MDSRARNSIDEHRLLLGPLEAELAYGFDPAVSMLVHAVIEGHKVLVVGNGLSWAISIAFGSQIVGLLGLPAVALEITATMSPEVPEIRCFSNQVEALGDSGDVLVAISATPTPPPNLLEAIASAKRAGMPTLGLCGKKGLGCDVDITLPDAAIQRVHEMHLVCVNLLVEGMRSRLPP